MSIGSSGKGSNSPPRTRTKKGYGETTDCLGTVAHRIVSRGARRTRCSSRMVHCSLSWSRLPINPGSKSQMLLRPFSRPALLYAMTLTTPTRLRHVYGLTTVQTRPTIPLVHCMIPAKRQSPRMLVPCTRTPSGQISAPGLVWGLKGGIASPVTTRAAPTLAESSTTTGCQLKFAEVNNDARLGATRSIRH